MATEIERKFLLRDDSWRQEADAGVDYRQGYLPGDTSVAVRVRAAGDAAWLTIKSGTQGISRREFEYPIPLADADEMLQHLCRRPLIEKRRHKVHRGKHVWEIDVFRGDNEGLVVAEIELCSVDEPFERPAWLGREVSDDARYFNARLSQHPYREWRDDL
jgi:adenylate cyclase